MKTDQSIFISIASYRDAELVPTLLDMVENAHQPASLKIAVCWQHDDDETIFNVPGITFVKKTTHNGLDLYTFKCKGARINVLSVHYCQSRGACWARHLAESLYQGEDYFLQIDSHCRFVDKWDAEMVTILENLRHQSEKPILSTYPPGYEPDVEDSKKYFTNRLIFREFTQDGLIMLSSTTINAEAPVRGSYLAGGFVFADGSYVVDVPNDPNIFFAGEEIAMAARAFTHGYDVYTPHKILLWHYYERQNSSKVWGDHSNEAKQSGIVEKAWWEWDKISKSRVRTVLGLENPPCDLGPYAHGTKRTFRDFENTIGALFQSSSVRPEVTGKELVSYFSPQACLAEGWLDGMVHPNKKTVSFTSEELAYSEPDIAWWHVGVYSEENVQLNKQTLKKDEIEALLKKQGDDTIQLSLKFDSQPDQKPHVIRVCPFFETQGWGETVEKSW
ncbi:UDP-N-acetylglucosamine-transferase [Enterobacteriaceae bacterium H11S18]|uniref:GlcNAc-transferase family protein n=1 Tax=Dryocola clanedunensis TaxID=2925396 RepID=UPI0022F12EA6|nr:GlcNAc-transferase family protein [Dryocola clanedunensis]MCT4710925.1 UDP-N-acetylglucosamine-transferase [Dryocola clanedunensis]